MTNSLFFDIGANRGEATYTALSEHGFTRVVAVEPAPRMFPLLAENFYGDSRVIPLKFAVSDTPFESIEFYECGTGQYGDGDGMSTMDITWLNGETARFDGYDNYRVVKATTCTLDWLIEQYGKPKLVKIDVEGGETQVMRGLTQHAGTITFEWVFERLDQHIEDIERLAKICGYTEYGPQYVRPHLLEPDKYFPISSIRTTFKDWLDATASAWEADGHRVNPEHLYSKADTGMLWVR